ncbi:unnamed protein product [Lactuca saligna]|uniref:Uncharacterized protein n=1 Tax=Lactuca saligna TaxID=75948 RepID=A0AA35VAA8_LACSI|nr:unnamed protein product [Lactuca saligna]
MAASSETTSVVEQTTSTFMLKIKHNQNLDLDLESSKYAESLNPLIEGLRYSPLSQALTMDESVWLIHLSKAFSIALVKRIKCDHEIDENLRVAKEAEAREKEARDAQVTLKTQKALFPPWSIEHILNKDVDNMNVYCSEPVASFELEKNFGVSARLSYNSEGLF